MIDKAHIGLKLAPHTAEVETGRLKFFAKATGQTDPIYSDEDAARAAGFSALPAPPTFAIAMEMERPDPFELFSTLGIDLRRLLHGAQEFTYHAPIVAGDRLTFSSKVADIFAKKGGALEFVIRKTAVTNQNGALVAELTSTLVVRNG